MGRAVAQLAGWLGFRVVATDDRPMADGDSLDAAAPGTDSGAGVPDELIIGTVDDVLAGRRIDPDVSVVLVTRNVDVDAAALPALLATGAGYVGVMGRERRWATTRARLE